MRRRFVLLSVVSLSMTLASCAAEQAEMAAKARSDLVGLSQSTIRMCAGLATKVEKDRSGDIWMYEHGTSSPGGFASPTLVAPIVGGVQLNQPNGYCRVQLRFVNNRVAEVQYAGETDIMGARDAACAQMVRTCLEQRERQR